MPVPQGRSSRPRGRRDLVIFDHPMAALEPLPLDETTAFLKFEPPFAGTYRWMGTKTLAFIPKARLPFGTEIQ